VPVATRDLITVNLEDGSSGHEQSGRRTAVVIKAISDGRFPILVVVPTSSQLDKFPVGHLNYPRLRRGAGNKAAEGAFPGWPGLDSESVVVLDQIRSIDPNDAGRGVRVVGRLSNDEFKPLMSSLIRMLGVSVQSR
jgi:mRNA-degrading endonuclease toxin of MazEF toxin-antitoxin module